MLCVCVCALRAVLRSGHEGWVRTVAVDPTNEWRIAQVVSVEWEVCLLNVVAVLALRFASSGNDRLIKIWDLASGTYRSEPIVARC